MLSREAEWSEARGTDQLRAAADFCWAIGLGPARGAALEEGAQASGTGSLWKRGKEAEEALEPSTVVGMAAGCLSTLMLPQLRAIGCPSQAGLPLSSLLNSSYSPGSGVSSSAGEQHA